ncbi:MAG: rhodanese-related sulfurtransferase [Gammaproteobacteria bacterium]|jgi:rhodanese-related sulfurtransferase
MNDHFKIEQFRALFNSKNEFAVIDPRTAEEFESGHILAASNLPLSTLKFSAQAQIPVFNSTIIICSDDPDLNHTAATVLEWIGYTDIHILDEGFVGWRQSGGALFSGLNVPGKSFGEFVEHHCKTPTITVDDFLRRRENQESFLLLDARTSEEHTSYCVPDSILCSATDMLYRVNVDRGDLIFVHCGGRTRSIIGAQTLVDAGFKNVSAFENGTMAWQAKNLPLEGGNQKSLPALSQQNLLKNQKWLGLLASRRDISRLSQVPESKKTLYLLDIRSKSEYDCGHIPGSVNAPGGQLVQAVDCFILVRNADVVLIDSDHIRATTAAIWLSRMGITNIKVLSINNSHTLTTTHISEIEVHNTDRALNPNDYSDFALLLEQNRKYLEWEIALYEQMKGDPVANLFSVD